ncbi:MAG: hypothetical protein IPM43_12755 [Actinomycetota bacterium]|nr:MAG: hypothetical protein IPM43_12755 [Actinomycetota bacterium]
MSEPDNIARDADREDAARDDAHDLELLRRYEPIVRFTEGEYFFPAPVESYVRSSALWTTSARGRRRIVAERGQLALEGLVELDAKTSGELFLALVGEPASRIELIRWRLRRDRPRFRAGTRLGQVGVLSRLVDAFNRASLIVRGKVGSGSEAAAEMLYRADASARDHHPYYGRVVHQAGYVVLQYWYFYYFNDWRSRAHGVNDHEGDWEQVTIFLAEQDDGPARPAWVAFSAHDEVGDDLRRRWDDPDMTREGDHPVVFAGLGSHSGAYLPGDYLISVDPASLPAALRWSRQLSRFVLPWLRGTAAERFGVPYVDYSRGDGRAIGPGCTHSWTPVPIDDDTDWVIGYFGLWGNDTEDPFGGERGPAGPRYERGGIVRASWADPVGWAGLEKVAPNEGECRRLVEERVTEIDEQIAVMAKDQVVLRRKLRTEVAAGHVNPSVDEAGVRNLTAERVALEDARRRLQRVSATAPTIADPHAHLRHRNLPLPATMDGRQRVLQVWSAISTPLVFVAVALMFMPLGRSVAGVGLAGVLVITTLEAIARGRLFAFLVGLVALLVGGAVVVALIVGMITEWRLTVVAVLLLAALSVLLLNLVELRRS